MHEARFFARAYDTPIDCLVILPRAARAILAVGDSFTAGADVAEHESYAAQLEATLDYATLHERNKFPD